MNLKSMIHLIQEVQRKYLPAIKKGWDNNILPETSNLYYKKGWDKNQKFPKGKQEIPLSKLWMDKSKQSALSIDNIDRIIKNFDPTKFKPITCTKDKDKYFVVDGRHRAVVLGIIGRTNIEVNIKEEEYDPNGLPKDFTERYHI